jgi:hypothetical protein
MKYFIPGLLIVRRWGEWFAGSTRSNNAHNGYIWEDDVFWRGEPWTIANAVCFGGSQVIEETRSMPCCWRVFTSLLVSQEFRRGAERGRTGHKCITGDERCGTASVNWFNESPVLRLRWTPVSQLSCVDWFQLIPKAIPLIKSCWIVKARSL